jgi:hypothetical protein
MPSFSLLNHPIGISEVSTSERKHPKLLKLVSLPNKNKGIVKSGAITLDQMQMYN